ncbi:hypothetical protein D9615_010611 [Tricholomella constricta]|uniref:Uncharacterized protein n=1 Tax=Tricholomella constricta TaxID=117010 RepID=A0A8H5GL20_9AGAR|nr:hypothetical protein D9615_010611 [Tricholomella constricta]
MVHNDEASSIVLVRWRHERLYHLRPQHRKNGHRSLKRNKDLNVRPYPPNPVTLLARSKYIHAVLQPEPDECMHLDAQFSPPNILLSSASGRGLEDMLTGDAAALLAEDQDEDEARARSKILARIWK